VERGRGCPVTVRGGREGSESRNGESRGAFGRVGRWRGRDCQVCEERVGDWKGRRGWTIGGGGALGKICSHGAEGRARDGV